MIFSLFGVKGSQVEYHLIGLRESNVFHRSSIHERLRKNPRIISNNSFIAFSITVITVMNIAKSASLSSPLLSDSAMKM